ncbi:MAG: N-acetylmuramoyl-L-alanine amidase [Blastocatellia bacterium]
MNSQAGKTTGAYSKIVERYAQFFDRPDIRLRFLHRTLSRQTEREKQLHQSLRHFRFLSRTGIYRSLMEAMLYRLIFEEIESFLPSVPAERRPLLRQLEAPLSARIFFQLYQVRYLFYGLGIGVAAFAIFGLYLGILWSARNLNGLVARLNAPAQPVRSREASDGADPGGTKYLPDYNPEKVWLVGKDGNSEQYSNGARIQTDYETDNHPRQYYITRRGYTEPERRVHRDPLGLIYHTSENEMVDFKPDNNDSIQARTRGLLKYIQQGKSYNYLIDRFGQTYRVVRDDQAAHHAGNSIWADKKNLYIGLNESFIGVCFESTMENVADTEEHLTEAQLISGRALTAVLRSRYNMDDANCVTHGLVSVNPESGRICYHYDGARGFPFDAMGLSDKYWVPPVSVSEFGFEWDEEVVGKLGGQLWPGARLAEEEFRRRVVSEKTDAGKLRRKMRDFFREQMETGRRLREGGLAQVK